MAEKVKPYRKFLRVRAGGLWVYKSKKTGKEMFGGKMVLNIVIWPNDKKDELAALGDPRANKMPDYNIYLQPVTTKRRANEGEDKRQDLDKPEA